MQIPTNLQHQKIEEVRPPNTTSFNHTCKSSERWMSLICY